MSGDQAIASVKSAISPAARTQSKAAEKFVSKRAKVRLLASREDMTRIMGIDPALNPDAERGYIDYWGFSPGLEGWIVGGWARTGALTSAGACSIEAVFGEESLALDALFVTFLRTDVADYGLGFLMFIA